MENQQSLALTGATVLDLFFCLIFGINNKQGTSARNTESLFYQEIFNQAIEFQVPEVVINSLP